jgi:hypothetical protein
LFGKLLYFQNVNEQTISTGEQNNVLSCSPVEVNENNLEKVFSGLTRMTVGGCLLPDEAINAKNLKLSIGFL